jgi:hypothetical protein
MPEPDRPITIAGNKRRIRAAARTAVLYGLLCAIILLAGCLPFRITPITTTAGSSAIEQSATVSSQTGSTETSGPETSGESETTSLAADTFEARVADLLLAGLRRQKTAIKIDDAIDPRAIAEDDVEAAIDLVFAAFQKVYRENPEFFYLSGSINVTYTLDSISHTLAAMTVKPDYWDSMANLSSSELAAMIDDVDAIVDNVADQIDAQTSVPWKQLLLLHEYLVRNIRYDVTLNQDNNHVYSALVDHLTLCQGYAQSFQLIAQRLGFAVIMVLGEADGIGHAWDIVKLDGNYYHIDVTFDDPTPDGGADDPVQHVYFLRSDSRMAGSHAWEKSDYPACPEDGAYYYRKQGLTVDSRDALQNRLQDFVAAIDFSAGGTNRLELLYTGAKPPDNNHLEDMVRAALHSGASSYSVLFSHQVNLGVILVDIMPD